MLDVSLDLGQHLFLFSELSLELQLPLFVLIRLTLLHLLHLFQDVAFLQLPFMERFLEVLRYNLKLLVRVQLDLLDFELVVKQKLLVR